MVLFRSTTLGTRLDWPAAAATTIQCKTSSSCGRTAFIRFASARIEPLYRYHGFFFANLPAVAFGCARRMIDEFRELAQRKITPPALTPLKNEYRAQVALAEANMRLSTARAYQDSSLGSVWQALSRGETPTAAQRAAVGMMAIHGLQEALKVGEIVCEAAGTVALYASSPFERRRRDLITMSNHIIGQRRTQQAMGQLLFGEEVLTHV